MSAQRKTPGATNALILFFCSVSRNIARDSKILTFKEQIELGRLKNIRNKRGKRTRQSQAAFDELVVRNLRLAIGKAGRYKNYGVELDDLISAGCEGLMKAVEKYDPKRRNTFSTYANWWIRQSILHELWFQRSDLRVGYNEDQAFLRFGRLMHKHHVLHGRYPNREEAARLTGLTPKQCGRLMRHFFIIKQIIGEGEPRAEGAVHESALADRECADPAAEHDREVLRLTVEKVFADARAACFGKKGANKARRDLKILRRHLMNQETLVSIGRRYHISRERARQICNRERLRMRQRFEERGISLDDFSL